MDALLEAIQTQAQRRYSMLSLQSEDTVASVSGLKPVVCRVASDAEKGFSERGDTNLCLVLLTLHAHIMDNFM